MQVKQKVEFREVVGDRDSELLISTISPSRAHNGDLGDSGTLTFPASLATNAVIESGPSSSASCFTSYVSSSFSSHIIAKLNDGSVKGMVQARGWAWKRRSALRARLLQGVSKLAAAERTLKIKANQFSKKSVRLSTQAVMHVMNLVPNSPTWFLPLSVL